METKICDCCKKKTQKSHVVDWRGESITVCSSCLNFLRVADLCRKSNFRLPPTLDTTAQEQQRESTQ